jgi:phenylacetate-CoA ligase
MSGSVGSWRAEALEKLWGAEVFDTYGIHECGSIACDCAHKSGMHIFEDAYLVEILEPNTLAPKRAGERGALHVTTLFRHLAPVIRYNVNDVSSIAPGVCACGSTHRQLEKIYGRSDNMVKLRGVNVFPEAVCGLVGSAPLEPPMAAAAAAASLGASSELKSCSRP